MMTGCRASAPFGILITMYYRDHAPPHFHARYGEHEAQARIDDASVLGGLLPPRAQRLVWEWADSHRSELEANWQRARARQALAAIEPLP